MKEFGFFWRIFLKIIFLHGEIFECFHYSSFALRYFLMQMARPQCVTHPLLLKSVGGWVGRWKERGFCNKCFCVGVFCVYKSRSVTGFFFLEAKFVIFLTNCFD